MTNDLDRKMPSRKKTSITYFRILRKLMKDKVVKDTDLSKYISGSCNKEGIKQRIRRLRGHGFDITYFTVMEKQSRKRKGSGYKQVSYYYLKGVLDIGDMYNERRNEDKDSIC